MKILNLFVKCILFSTIFVGNLSAQNDSRIHTVLSVESSVAFEKSAKDLWRELEGTYQFVLTGTTQRLLLTKDLYQLAISSRKSDKDIHLKIDEAIELFLPSSNAILSGSFKRLEPVLISK